jgi:hypothetical protein
MLRITSIGTMGSFRTASTGTVQQDERTLSVRRHWKHLQLAALSVLSLSRRDDQPNERLWYYPASRFEELQSLAPPGSEEFKAKAQFEPNNAFRKFGNASITVSWKALTAIEAATGMRPAQSSEIAQDVAEFRSPTTGNYGSKVYRKEGNFTINENARHTAMALLTQMSFGTDQKPATTFSRFERPVRWLITNAILPDGGWAFEQTEESKRDGLGATSTIAGLMALSQFVKNCGRHKLIEAELFNPIREEVILSLRKLIAARKNGIWDLSNEGLPPETRVAESAYVISGLRHAIRYGNLGELVDGVIDVEEILRRFQLDLLSIAVPLGYGWPANIGGLSISPAATICSLHAVCDLPPAMMTVEMRDLVQRADERLLADVRRDNGWEFLRTWDWATLAELTTARIGPVSLSEWRALSKGIAAVRDAKRLGRLSTSVLRRVPAEGRLAVHYCLTRGGTISVRHSLTSHVADAALELLKRTGWGIWTAGIGFFVGILLAKYFGWR